MLVRNNVNQTEFLILKVVLQLPSTNVLLWARTPAHSPANPTSSTPPWPPETLRSRRTSLIRVRHLHALLGTPCSVALGTTSSARTRKLELPVFLPEIQILTISP